jgi:uncharacterized protein (DUF58 family)
MIVPRARLLIWVAMLVIPCGLLTAAQPGTELFCLLALGGLAVLCAIDALRGRRILQGISVQLPGVVRLSTHRSGRLDVRVHNQKPAALTLRFAVALPEQIESAQGEMQVSLPKEHEWSHFSWNCLPHRKGVFHAGSACLELATPLGLWGARKCASAPCEIRVYPNLLSERKNLAALFLNRGSFGLHVQRQVGKGREFEKLREYVPGDGFEDVHWKATAKRGKPVTKVFQIERTQEIYVVIDASRLAARASRSVSVAPTSTTHGETTAGSTLVSDPETSTVLDRYVAAALVLGLVAERQGDLFGLLTFSDKVDRFVRARNGKAHFNVCRDALYTLEPTTVTPDYEELFTFIRLRLRRRALLILLTALDDPVLSESFVRNVELIRRQHLVLVNMIQPPGLGPLFEGPEPGSVDELYQHLGGHLLWENLCELEKVLQRRGVRFSLLQDERLSWQLVHQYLTAKRRQAL